jgi:RarD protein
MSILSARRTNSSCGERERSEQSQTLGLIAGIAAFTTWGLIPIYWKLLAAAPATEILAHRFVWTTIFLSILLSWQRRAFASCANLLPDRRAGHRVQLVSVHIPSKFGMLTNYH